jgi:sorting nexin-9/18/33
MAHPDLMYHDIISTHDATLLRYKDSLADTSGDKVRPLAVMIEVTGYLNCIKTKAEQLASRCETVLNATMSEMDVYHTQKVEDFGRMAKEHLDGEIRLYEQVKWSIRCTSKLNLKHDFL